MKSEIDRRSFLQTGGAALGTAAGAALLGKTEPVHAGQFTGRIRKAVGFGMIQEGETPEDKLRIAKGAGFDGVEIYVSNRKQKDPLDPKAVAAASEKAGIVIHGVVNSNGPDIAAAIDEAVIYGASSVLQVVPPDPNASFREHYQLTQDLIRKAIPHAEKNKVHILIENVWSTFLIEPLTMARYLDEIGSPWVKAYFDIGNVVRWGWPQHWIEVLGPERIEKIHIKEYNLDVAMKEGMHKGFDFPLGNGSIQWDKVRAALLRNDYRGWATAEVKGGDAAHLADISRQMDEVLEL